MGTIIIAPIESTARVRTILRMTTNLPFLDQS